MDEVGIRPMTAKDESFIYATWLRSYRHSSRFAERIGNEVFFSFHKKIIELILERASTSVLIAHLKDDPNIILGYFCFERRGGEDVAHFVFVKKSFRNLKIAKALFLESKIDPSAASFTHWTHPMSGIVEKLPGIKYNPYNL